MRNCFPRIAHGLCSLVVVLLLAACGGGGGGGDTVTASPGPYQLTFSMDASFQVPHGDNTIHIAVVRSSDNVVVDGDFGTVSATQNPSFSFVSGAVMERGIDYEVHYWIDSNIGGGTLGVCDPITNDHQWRVQYLSVTNDKNLPVSHNPALMVNVCPTFP
ncbi:MAG: hypothetical protein OEM47_01075 [Deltaproteobacteria bacterium]|nr:hypothetical protein [Deltaproteobacteria bacterium]